MLIIATVVLFILKLFSKNFAPIFPGAKYTRLSFEFFNLNFISASIVCKSAVLLIGSTSPEVPRIDIPPIIPSLSLNVFLAISAPFSTVTVIFTIPLNPCSFNITERLSIIICLGTGLIAASPFGNARPSFVNTPTPSPAKKLNSRPFSFFINSSFVLIRIPSVTSGSSPAFFLTPQVNEFFSFFTNSNGIVSVIPAGNSTSTISLLSFRYIYAAPIAAAVAVVPVVKPYLCVCPFFLLYSSIVIFMPLVS